MQAWEWSSLYLTRQFDFAAFVANVAAHGSAGSELES